MTIKLLHERYPSLFHYTNAAGLDGILKSQTLWATDAEHLNDSQELKAAREILSQKIIETLQLEYKRSIREGKIDGNYTERQVGGSDTLLKDMSDSILNAMYDALKKNFAGLFLTSFCSIPKVALNSDNEIIKDQARYELDHGLLSQWRGYGAGGGYAIEFDTATLMEVKVPASVRAFDSVVYKHEKSVLTSRFSKDFELIRRVTINFWKEIIVDAKNIRKAFSNEAAIAFLNLITFIKSQGFYEEKEIRISQIVFIDNADLLEACQRNQIVLAKQPCLCNSTRNGKLVPYIKLFPEFDSANDDPNEMKLPIKRIIVGPHPDKEGRVQALKTLLHNVRVPSLGNAPIEIHPSDIPYIG